MLLEKKNCASYDEEGLNVRPLVYFNEAKNLKLCWDLSYSKEHWTFILRSRVLRNTTCINHHIFSFIWSGTKNELHGIKDNSSWLISDGNQINFWFDSWCGDPLAQKCYSLYDYWLSHYSEWIHCKLSVEFPSCACSEYNI